MSQKSVQTTCPYCGVGCGMEVMPQKNSALSTSGIESYQVKVIGDESHPANFGRLCVKGSAAGETVDFEGRMLAPQVNGKEVSWDTALTTVADAFKHIIKEHGSDAVAFYVSGQLLTEDYYVANKLMKGFMGSANIDTNSRLCMASAVVGYKRAFGSDTVPCSYQDLEQADLIVLVGSNTAWAHPIVYQRIAAEKKRRPNLKIVVIDPRKTATCDLADLHLPLKPGSDATLFNGLLAHLAQANALDNAFIEQHSEGFSNALATAKLAQGTLSDVAQQCELDPTDLQLFFDWATERHKMVTLYSQGVNQSTSGVDKSNAIINCHLATGRLGQAGMGPFSITGQPNAMGGREVGGLANQLAAHMDFNTPENIDRVARFWQAENMASQNGLKAIEMFQAVGEGKIKAIWIINTNPVVSMPDADAVKKALQGCDMVVVSDCIQHTDTTDVANVLLPALTWGENGGTVTNSDRTISRQRPFMQGPENARSDWWMICQVAQKMGFKTAFDYQNEAEIFREHAALSGFENAGTRDFDISHFEQITTQEYDDLAPFQWPINAQNPQGTVRMFGDRKFFTPSGKAQFIAITPKAPAVPTSKAHPFILNTGRVRDQWHTMTRTAKTPKLMAHTDEPYVAIHPEDANKQHLLSGELARISNPLGTVIARVVLDEGQRKGSLFIPMHWTAQYASHGRVDVLVAAHADPLSGQPEFKHCPVNISPYVAKWHGFILSRHPINTDGLDYWVKIKGKQFYRYEIAGEHPIKDHATWAESLLGRNGDVLEYQDMHGGRYRKALIKDGILQSVLFIAPSINLPPRTWLGTLFTTSELDAKTRLNILAGQLSGAKDEGKMICSCFGIGLNTIVDAIQKDKLTTVEAIGQALKAGTNCGSCLPELKDILASELK
ncbi:Assimilatory nitrate reductase large subunit [hydrothermal vent metagenome]|uniref:Assimilatory nitrate reductase large subunit n=1 Tax=hydrothermal vent metagenome TaxID=652676 RepID=A0A3B0VXR2_9ZZZZ